MTTTVQMAVDLAHLPIEKQLIAIDELGNQYVFERDITQYMFDNEERNWCYALKLKKTGIGCIKR